MKKLTTILILLPAASWAEADSNWLLDTADAISISQDGGNPIKDESYTKEVTPSMAFVCLSGGSITAQIDWKRFISSFSTEVGFKVDDGKFTWLKWKVDGSEKVTLSPSADDTRKLVAALGMGSNLLVEITPYSESPVEVSFDLAGLTGKLDELGKACQ